MRIFKFIFILGIIIICSGVYAQTADTTAASPGSDDFVDLSDQATIIKVEPEKPRVTLITERIKPQAPAITIGHGVLVIKRASADPFQKRKSLLSRQKRAIDSYIL